MKKNSMKKLENNQDFDEYKFGIATRVVYEGKEYRVASVIFKERLIGLIEEHEEDLELIIWIRYENMDSIHEDESLKIKTKYDWGN